MSIFYIRLFGDKLPLVLLLFTDSCFHNGLYIGYVLDKLELISSAHDCQKKCQEHPSCQYWTFGKFITFEHGLCLLQDYDAALDNMPCDPIDQICTRGPKFCQGR